MNNIDIKLTIRSFALFNHLEDEALEAIAKNIEIESFSSKSIIVSQGDLGNKIYFIASGKNQAYILNKKGEEIIIAELETGNYFGELALLGSGFRTCFIRASTPTTLFSLTKHQFDTLIKNHPSISLALNTILTERLTETLNLVTERKKNHIILLLCHPTSSACLNEFIQYFQSISPKPTKIIEPNTPRDEINKILNSLTNHYVLIKQNLSDNSSYINFVDSTVCFDEQSNEGFLLPPNSNTWKIGHVARRITGKTVGIALCSGGAPAASHLGVLKTLQEENIPLDYIVGSSSGALFGACFAFNIPYEQIINAIIKETQSSLLKKILFNFSFKFSGLIQSNYYKKLFASSIGDKQMEEAIIPYAAVASDLYSGDTVVIKTGPVVDAVLASNAAPIILEPIYFNNQLLVDGVATAPLPTHVLVDEKIDIKIAVPISQLHINIEMKKNPKLLTVYLRSRAMMAEEILRKNISLADVIIEPNIEGIKMLDWTQFEKTIQRGEEAAKMAIKRIKNLLSAQINN